MVGGRTPFSEKDDIFLSKYIATYNPGKAGRLGNILYQRLVENEDSKWSWSNRHPWQSWRERYSNKQSWFDRQIKAFQKRKGILSPEPAPQGSKKKIAAQRREAVDESGEEDPSLGMGKMVVNKKRKRVEEEGQRRKKAKEEEQEAGPMGPYISKEERAAANGEPSSILQDEDNGNEINESEASGSNSVGLIVGDKVKETQVAEEGDESLSTGQNPPADSTRPPHLLRKSNTTLHSTPNGNEPLYPDLSNLPSPILSQPNNDESHDAEPHIPGAFDAAIKHESPTQVKLAPEMSIQNLHPSQEPTPPLSNADFRSPDPDTSERGIPDEQLERKTVFPGGNYRTDLPTRTDTVGIRSSSPTPSADSDAEQSGHKPKLRRRSSADSNFFRSAAPTPAPSRQARMTKQPLRLVEGPFGSSFTDGRGKAPISWGQESESSGDNEDADEERDIQDALEWPPRRESHRQADDKSKWKARTEPSAAKMTISSTVAMLPPRQVATESKISHHAFSQPSQTFTTVLDEHPQRNTNSADASSSADTHHPFSQPAPMEKASYPPLPRLMGWRAFFDILPNPEGTANSNSSDVQAADFKAKRPYVPSSRIMAAVAPSKSAGGISPSRSLGPNPLVDSANHFQSPVSREPSTASSGDPFLVRAVPQPTSDPKGKGKLISDATLNDEDRRKTFGGIGGRSAIPNIDLVSRMNRPQHRRIFSLARQAANSSPAATVSPAGVPSRRASAPVGHRSTSFSTSSSPLNMSLADQEIALRYGSKGIIKLMSQNRGFTEDVVTRVWEHCRNFELADAELKRMWEAAEASFYKNNSGDEQVDGEPFVLPQSSPRRVSNPSGLQFTAAPVDSGNISDYSPPEITRAAKFRQGHLLETSIPDRRTGSLVEWDEFLKKFGTSEGSPFREASTGAHSLESVPAPAGRKQDMGIDMLSSPPPQPIWGEQDDKLLLSGDAAVLKELEERMGRFFCRQRTAELYQTSV